MIKEWKLFATALLFIFIHQFVFADSFKKYSLFITTADSTINPLLVYSNQWSDPVYQKCNTAQSLSYLNQEEKKIIWVLNMVRLNPQLFLNTVLLNPKCSFYKSEKSRNSYDKSLIKTLEQTIPITRALQPDSSCYVSAHCHAYYSGIKGYVGHQRVNKYCREDFNAECCQYGYSDGLSIVISLLLDYNIPSLGHRKICLANDYNFVGVSIQDHTKYQYNSVIDFK